MGRHSEYTQEIADVILDRLIDGESLSSICRDDGMPRAPAVYRWLDANEDFRKGYALARESQAEKYADEIIDIADEKCNDTVIGKNGEKTPNAEWISRSRLRVDSRKWIASKLLPKKYGDSTTLKGDKENPLQLSLAQALDEAEARLNGK